MAQQASTSNGYNQPPRPAHCAAEPSGYYRFSRVPRPTASYVQFLLNGRLTLFQCSDTRPTGKRHKRELGDSPDKSAGILRGSASWSSLPRLRIGRADTAQHLQNPRARDSLHLNGGSPMLAVLASWLAVRSQVPLRATGYSLARAFEHIGTDYRPERCGGHFWHWLVDQLLPRLKRSMHRPAPLLSSSISSTRQMQFLNVELWMLNIGLLFMVFRSRYSKCKTDLAKKIVCI